MRVALSATATLLTLAYPALVYWGLVHLDARAVGLLLLAVLLPLFALRMRGRRGDQLRSVLPVGLTVVALLLAAVLVRDHRFVLALPVAINLSLLVHFGATLRRGPPMVERFARMQEPDLTEDKVRYCRTVTIVWCGFFVLNAAVTAGLALWAPVAWWTLYTGLVAYGLMGFLFAAELVVRKARFRTYGSGPLDRAFAAVFPPRPEP